MEAMVCFLKIKGEIDLHIAFEIKEHYFFRGTKAENAFGNMDERYPWILVVIHGKIRQKIYFSAGIFIIKVGRTDIAAVFRHKIAVLFGIKIEISAGFGNRLKNFIIREIAASVGEESCVGGKNAFFGGFFG